MTRHGAGPFPTECKKKDINPVIVDSDIEFSIKNVALFKYFMAGKPSNRYLHYCLVHAQTNMKAISSGAVQSFVSLGFLRNYPFPLPPLPEQYRIVARIESGETIALVSDAGTPGISDPGFLLVRTCIAHGVEVETLPGATAFVPALIQSGFPADRFCFEGFLPQKKGRNKRLEQLKEETRTIIFYESPYRVV